MDLSFLQHLPNFSWIVYALLFVCMFLEANTTVVGSVILISHSIVRPLPAIILVTAGAFGEQYFLYWLGSRLGRRERTAAYINKAVSRYDSHILLNTLRSLFFSKFVYGLHRVVVLRCGMLKISFKRFVKTTAKSTGAWLLVMFGLGFVFSVSYQALLGFVKYGEIALLIIIIAFFALQYYISQNLRKDL